MGYSIICNARRGKYLGIEHLAMVDRNKTKRRWWTSDDISIIKRFNNIHVARTQLKKINYNNPEIINYKEAIKLISRQNKNIMETEMIDDDLSWDAHKEK